jgi:hypothetical protein
VTTYVYSFEKVTHRAEKRVPCTICGRKMTRAKTFWQTLNPFNKNADGDVKSREEIYRELKAEADAWKSQPETHWMCAESAA